MSFYVPKPLIVSDHLCHVFQQASFEFARNARLVINIELTEYGCKKSFILLLQIFTKRTESDGVALLLLNRKKNSRTLFISEARESSPLPYWLLPPQLL